MPQKSPPTEWVNVSNHPVTFASGRPLAPGENGPCDMTHPHDQALRDAGIVVEADTGKEKS